MDKYDTFQKNNYYFFNFKIAWISYIYYIYYNYIIIIFLC